MVWLVSVNIPRWERKVCKTEIYATKEEALERQNYIQNVLHKHAEVLEVENGRS